MTTSRLALAALATSALTSALVLTGSPAHASHGGGDGGRVTKTGACSDGARWKVKAKSDDGQVAVEGEVDSNQSGQTWAWKIVDNGAKVSSGRSTTGGRSGSFSVERRISDRAGTDSITFRATYAGQVCKGSVAF